MDKDGSKRGERAKSKYRSGLERTKGDKIAISMNTKAIAQVLEVNHVRPTRRAKSQ